MTREFVIPLWAVRAFKASVVAGGFVVGLLSVIALILVLQALDRITEVQCNTHETIAAILRGQGDPGARERQARIYANLGFSASGIALIFREQETGRAATLRTLGPTPARCIPAGAERATAEWPYPIPSSWRIR